MQPTQNATRPTPILGTANRPEAAAATIGQAASRWRNLWFLAKPASTTWGENSYATQAEAEQQAQADAATFAEALDAYGDHACVAPYEWLMVSRLRFAHSLPCQASR